MKPEADPFETVSFFTATLFNTGGKGGWTFAPIPADIAPPVTGAWGMTPVIAQMNGREWKTTVWKDKTGRSLLPVPKKVRGQIGDGDVVSITLRMDRERAFSPRHPRC